MISSYIIPILIILLIIYSVIKRKNAYSSFVYGAKTSFDLVLTSFPYIVAIFIAIELFSVSGLSTIMGKLLAPLFNILGIPTELSELILLKPFSGCGSLAVLENIFSTYGVDSYLARAGCAIVGSSEAIFYITAVYFSGTKVKKFSYGIPVAIISNLLGVVAACLICKVI
ncbi:MAG: spore maturation protein [Clostridia bacterium]|nr:spore maturation protein [Clostridia bacterium]